MIINPYYKRKAMTVNYKLLRTSGKLAQRKALRIVPIKKDVTGIERICQHIQQATTLTTADILGTISALKTELAEELKSGNTVHLPGIGFFSLALKGDIHEDPKTHHHHLRNVAVRKIRFRPDKDFHEALGKMDFENKTYKDLNNDRLNDRAYYGVKLDAKTTALPFYFTTYANGAMVSERG